VENALRALVTELGAWPTYRQARDRGLSGLWVKLRQADTLEEWARHFGYTVRTKGPTGFTREEYFALGLSLYWTFAASNGHVDIPQGYKDPGTGFPLRSWLDHRRKLRGKTRRADALLESVPGHVWDLCMARRDAVIARYLANPDSQWSRMWLSGQRHQFRTGAMSGEHANALRDAGIDLEA
jgi:hypothetical protein